MRIAITGSTGLVGTALCGALGAAGHSIVRLVRHGADPAAGRFGWDPQSGTIDVDAFTDCKGIVHLAGENIAAGRWNADVKARIRDSRILGTRTVCQALAAMDAPPKVLVSASAIGYYGDRGDEALAEDAPPGQGFLPDVCAAWEAETEPVTARGIRVVCVRIGMVLSAKGGALAKMLTPFKLGAGGVLGNGKQYMSWIDLDDLVGIIMYAVGHDALAGPVNAVAPNAVTNREFTKTLGRVIRRPTVFPVPAFAARLAFGEMADALLLASTRVVPQRVREAGYAFKYAQLEASLRHQLGR